MAETQIDKIIRLLETDGIIVTGAEFTGDDLTISLVSTDALLTDIKAELVKMTVGTGGETVIKKLANLITASTTLQAYLGKLGAGDDLITIIRDLQTKLEDIADIKTNTGNIDTNTADVPDMVAAIGAKDGTDTVMVRLDEITAAITTLTTLLTEKAVTNTVFAVHDVATAVIDAVNDRTAFISSTGTAYFTLGETPNSPDSTDNTGRDTRLLPAGQTRKILIPAGFKLLCLGNDVWIELEDLPGA